MQKQQAWLNLNMRQWIYFVVLFFISSHVNAQGESNPGKLKVKTTYVVKQGETFYGIARSYKMSVKELEDLNPEIDPSKLKPGMVLAVFTTKNIPSPKSQKYTWHIVTEGETMYSISRKYDISVVDIKVLNRLDDNNIFPGQKLKIKEKSSNAVEIVTDLNTAVEMPKPVIDSEEGGIIEKRISKKVKYVEKSFKATVKVLDSNDIRPEYASKPWVVYPSLADNQVIALVNPKNKKMIWAIGQSALSSSKPAAVSNEIWITPFIAERLSLINYSSELEIRFAVKED